MIPNRFGSALAPSVDGSRIVSIDGVDWIPRRDVCTLLGVSIAQLRRRYEASIEHRIDDEGRYLYKYDAVRELVTKREQAALARRGERYLIRLVGVDAENMRRIADWFLRLGADVAPAELRRLAKRLTKGL